LSLEMGVRVSIRRVEMWRKSESWGWHGHALRGPDYSDGGMVRHGRGLLVGLVGGLLRA
jgi:hypothetical protein